MPWRTRLPSICISGFLDWLYEFNVEGDDGEFKGDFYHRAHGYPLWYGREKPSLLTQHSITYGYNWSGDVDGTVWINGKEIKVKGTGQRERYVAVDSSAAELGA